jgi:hypothetical protein
MTDIAGLCNRLRTYGGAYRKEAADTLERQAAEIARLREALERVAHPTYGIEFSAIVGIARAALQVKTSDID